MNIKTYSIISAFMESIGWKDNILYIITKKSGTIKYINVPEHVYKAMKEDKFPGAYFGSNIKNKYKEEKIII